MSHPNEWKMWTSFYAVSLEALLHSVYKWSHHCRLCPTFGLRRHLCPNVYNVHPSERHWTWVQETDDWIYLKFTNTIKHLEAWRAHALEFNPIYKALNCTTFYPKYLTLYTRNLSWKINFLQIMSMLVYAHNIWT